MYWNINFKTVLKFTSLCSYTDFRLKCKVLRFYRVASEWCIWVTFSVLSQFKSFTVVQMFVSLFQSLVVIKRTGLKNTFINYCKTLSSNFTCAACQALMMHLSVRVTAGKSSFFYSRSSSLKIVFKSNNSWLFLFIFLSAAAPAGPLPLHVSWPRRPLLGSMEPENVRLPVQVLGENEALQQFFSGEMLHETVNDTVHKTVISSLRGLEILDPVNPAFCVCGRKKGFVGPSGGPLLWWGFSSPFGGSLSSFRFLGRFCLRCSASSSSWCSVLSHFWILTLAA